MPINFQPFTLPSYHHLIIPISTSHSTTNMTPITSVLTLALGVVGTIALPHPHRRAAVEVGQVYAYGANISGLPVFYADTKAYIGDVAPPNASVATNISCQY